MDAPLYRLKPPVFHCHQPCSRKAGRESTGNMGRRPAKCYRYNKSLGFGSVFGIFLVPCFFLELHHSLFVISFGIVPRSACWGNIYSILFYSTVGIPTGQQLTVFVIESKKHKFSMRHMWHQPMWRWGRQEPQCDLLYNHCCCISCNTLEKIEKSTWQILLGALESDPLHKFDVVWKWWLHVVTMILHHFALVQSPAHRNKPYPKTRYCRGVPDPKIRIFDVGC